MRVGKKYRLVNYGEISEFELLEVIGRNDYKLRDLSSLETYRMSELIQFGKGNDFELIQLYE
ncbi:MAG: hypothetical protein AAF789_02830 [Bacteroidota bacterium]